MTTIGSGVVQQHFVNGQLVSTGAPTAVTTKISGYGKVVHEVVDGTKYIAKPSGAVERITPKKCENYSQWQRRSGLRVTLNKSRIRRIQAIFAKK